MCARVCLRAVIAAAAVIGAGASQVCIAASDIPLLREGTELFVDDVNLVSKTSVTRTIHPARKLPAPVLTGDDGDAARIYGLVHRDAVTGQFRMWYGRSYAVSSDGLNWEKPLFSIYPRSGKPTNIVLAKGGGGVLVDEAEPDPAKRYKALLAESISVGGFSGYYSADGINWTRYGTDRLVTVGSEIGQVIRDPITRKYFAYIRPFAPKHYPKSILQKRLGAVITSDDFVNWSPMSVVLIPDAVDDAWVTSSEQRTEFYAMNGFPYGRSYLGIVPLFRITAIIDNPAEGQSGYDGPMEGQLITSRDGLSWSRMENRSPVIPSGLDYDQSIMNVANLPLIVGDEIWHYYTAINGTHGAPVPPKTITIALARWRLDGFVSLDAGDTVGWVETTVLNPGKACGLEVNADAAGGRFRVEVLDANGQPLPGYTVNDTILIDSDNVRHVARWQETERLPAQPFRLRFRYSNSKLFSYTLRDPIQTWRLTHFSSAEATGAASDMADPDEDGLVNLLEYALGSDPLHPQAHSTTASAVDGQWHFNYERPVDRTDLNYTVQVSTDLQTWTTAGVVHELVSVDGGRAAWRARYPQSLASNVFFRLVVDLPAPAS